MTIQFGTTLRNAWLATYESTISTSPKLRMYTGAPPATCATAASGTQLVEITCPSDWLAAPSGGAAAKSGTWSATAGASGTAGYYRVWDSAVSVCHEQGAITQAFALATSATTAAGNNVLTFASTTGVTDGMTAYGTGVPAGATVLSHTGTTVTLSAVSTAGVGSAETILFGDTSGDLLLASTAFTSGVTVVTISAKTMTAPGA